MSTDRIDKQILLRAALARVWQAISDSQQFGSWFGMAFDGPFVSGQRITGRIQPTVVDPEIARLQEPLRGFAFEIWIERLEPPRYLAFRWHPYAIERGKDYSHEPTTLVEFTLEERADGTLLRISESGFDRLPAARRVDAFNANEGGWTHQGRLLEKYLARRGD